MTEKLTPGPELDREVAAACGLYADGWRFPGRCCVNEPASHPIRYCDSDGVAWYTFAPSTDLNDAFFAAEKAGLFSRDYSNCVLKRHWVGEEWNVFTTDSGELDEILGSGPTPALAICAAILKLKEKA